MRNCELDILVRRERDFYTVWAYNEKLYSEIPGKQGLTLY